MAKRTKGFEYEWLESELELEPADKHLLDEARKATDHAYAPYSHFHVAAAARMASGTILTATNQENASYPVGICAERTLLSALSSVYPNEIVDTITVTYNNHNQGESDNPASPCGICRQSLLEYEQRQGKPIRLLLAGKSGPVIIVQSAADLLPFGFGPQDLMSG